VLVGEIDAGETGVELVGGFVSPVEEPGIEPGFGWLDESEG
jgi:hypothetical protein